jgi:protein-tyrosine phosphatase
LRDGRDKAAKIVGPEEAHHLVATRPLGILRNTAPNELPPPSCGEAGEPAGDEPKKGQRGGFMRRLFG